MLPAMPGDGHGDVPSGRGGESVRGCSRKFAHQHLVAGKHDPVVLVDQLATLTHDLESVRAGGLSRRRNEHTSRTVGETHGRGDIILNLDIMVTAKTTVGGKLYGHAKHPLEEV